MMVGFHILGWTSTSSFPGAGHPAGSDSRRRDRRFPGLLHRLQQDPLVHRHAGRHAHLPRTDGKHAAGPVRRAFRQRLPAISAGFIPDFSDFGFLKAAGSRAAVSLAVDAVESSAPRADLRKHPALDARQRAGHGDRTIRAFPGKNAIFAILMLASATCSPRTRACPTC